MQPVPHLDQPPHEQDGGAGCHERHRGQELVEHAAEKECKLPAVPGCTTARASA